MRVRQFKANAIAALLSLWLPTVAPADQAVWDQARVTDLAGKLHQGLSGLRDEMRTVSQDLGSGRAAAYYRLLDNLRVLERETRYLHRSLDSGSSRQVTLPAYRRIAMLRRDCAEEMERLFLSKPALDRISTSRTIIEQLNPYYGLDADSADH